MFNKKKNLVLGLVVLFTTTFCNSMFAQKVQQDIATSWYHRSFEIDSVFGIGTDQTYEYIKEKKYKPLKEVVVAVIDGGVDVNHEDLKMNIWVNNKEIPNGKDDDGNGYIDDLHGWNFLGKQGDTLALERVGTEAFREYKRLRPIYENMQEEQLALLTDTQKEEHAYFLTVRKNAGIGSYLSYFVYLQAIADAFRSVDTLLNDTYANNEILLNELDDLKPSNLLMKQNLEIVQGSTLLNDPATPWKKVYDQHIGNFELAKSRVESLDDRLSPRDSLVGDDIADINDRFYGNPMVHVDAYHGTLVSGIIGAMRGNGLGIEGIADHVRIMPIRAIPEGDEYDKDVALAIRYAVDNGADIINMSFGKDLSPNESWVNDAVRYASEKNVLLIQASGNSGRNIDSLVMYPTGYFGDGVKSNSYIKVGATNVGGDPFILTNYGKKEVDLFAPGVDVYSLSPDNGYELVKGGTSLAAPMVSGVAALIWSFFPQLTAAELKEVIVNSVSKRDKAEVPLPGKRNVGKSILFSELTASGGILNAYRAFLESEKINSEKGSIAK